MTASLERATPIAIIGMSARVPGARNLREFWDLLLAGRDAITEVPADRWRTEDYYAAKFGTPGKTHVRHGGFIANLFDFDHSLFGISAREAQRIDPQQLLALELAFSALEDAGMKKNNIELITALKDGEKFIIGWKFKKELKIEETVDLQAEVIQAAGGNALLLFREDEGIENKHANAIKFTKELTLRILQEAPGF